MTPARRPNFFVFGILIIALLGLIVFAPFYGWRLRALLTPSDVAPGVASSGANASSTGALLSENDALKAQLAQLQSIAAALPTSTQGFVRAMVYSRYPFGFKSELFVNVGSADGVATGSAVTYQGMLLGRVSNLWVHSAAVQTVFDDAFRLPVRIGASGTDGLLTGGSYPYIASIAPGAPIAAGDAIMSAAQGLPYGLPLGVVQSTSTSPDRLFQQAAISFPYNINTVETVLVAVH
jgi:cell shape-determining protein MreC